MTRTKLFPSLIFLVTISIILSLTSCKTRQKTIKIDEVEESINKDIDFPYDILGYWKGELNIISVQNKRQVIPMAMLIEETADSETFSWQIMYNEGEEQDTRSYLLMFIDPENGHYQIDEDNGIILDAYLFGNKLISTFSVQGSLLTVSYTFYPDKIHFEVIAGPVEAIHTTGNIKVGEASIPPVDSYQTSALQQGILKRIRG